MFKTLADVQAALEPAQFVECGASQEKSVGWIPPRGEAYGPLIESVGGQWIVKLMIESKAVPGNVVRRKADERIAEIEAATGRKPGKKEKRDIMDDALMSLNRRWWSGWTWKTAAWCSTRAARARPMKWSLR
jgi:recombination associated protein RdgC